MATTHMSSTLIAATQIAAGASTISAQRTLGSGVLCEAIHVYFNINASGFADTLAGGRNTLDCAIRPVAVNGGACYNGGPEYYQQRIVTGDAAQALLYSFRFPGGAPKLFKVAAINRTSQATANSGFTASIEYVTVAA
ncbi:MAG: hypothetical protein WC977_06515 [Anaerovoracaceae bacterium]|jgi:hypothetical protein